MTRSHRTRITPTLLAAAAAALYAPTLQAAPPPAGQPNLKPAFITSAIRSATYDGVNDDLLTGGLGFSGLLVAAPPFANPLAPTTTELRRNAIHTNYRALVDVNPLGGFGRLYGPNLDAGYQPTRGEGKVAGSEHIAVAGGPPGTRENVTLMVQVPQSFDPARPCIVTATSSGSRGLYGAIGTAGEWGLKRGCAVAYTDKGSGNGLHDLVTDTVTRIDGRLASATEAGSDALFLAPVSDAERNVFNSLRPDRVAFKHAHSGLNPEKDWGRDTLRAVEFAFYILNERFGAAGPGNVRRVTITPANTRVIASSVSNGGGAALAAAEMDADGLIDAVAVAEPNVQVGDAPVAISQGGQPVPVAGRPLLDYFTFANLYQPCAALDPAASSASVSPLFWPPLFNAFAANRCAGLRAKGLVSGDTTAAQAADALARLRGYGWTPESDFLHPSHYRLATNAIAVTYVNAYGRFKPTESVCGFSMANTSAATGAVVPQALANQAGIFATGNGVPPTTGVNLVYDDALGGPRLDFLGASPSTGLPDFSLDGALCLRALATGRDPVSGAPLEGAARAQAARVAQGVREVAVRADLRGKPAVIVAGRNDTLIPVNHAARAYVARNAAVEGAATRLRYIEVLPAQHFDSFLSFGPLLGYDTRFVPLHVYFNRAMDAVWAHLSTGAPLPPSQVVRATPRASSADPLQESNLPAWKAAPGADAITVAPGEVRVPQ